MNAVIFAGGTISGFNIDKYKDYDIICVDKGVEYAIDNNLNIKIAIGDFDSVDKSYLDRLNNLRVKKLTFNKDKDMTDLELSLDYVSDKKYKNVDIFGGLGTRFDHSLSNIFLLKTYSKNLNLRLIDKNNEIFYINKTTKIKKRDNKYISLLPTNNKCRLNLIGTKWELNNHNIKYGSSLTVSNKFKTDVIIEILEGDLFVMITND